MASTAGPSPDPIYVFSGFNQGVSAVSFVDLKGKHHLLTGDSFGETVLWDLATRKRWWSHQEENSSMQPSILACGSWCGGFWAHARGRCVRFWSWEEDSGISDVYNMPCPHAGFCGASILTGSKNNGVMITDLAALPIDDDGHGSFEVHEISESGAKLFTTVKLQSELESQPTGSPMMCLLTRLPSSEPLLIIGFESGAIQMWRLDPKNPQAIAEEKLLRESIMGMDFLASRRFGICVTPDKVVSCWQVVDDEADRDRLRIQKRDDLLLPRAGASAVRIRSDGRIFAVGGWDGKIRVFASKTLNPLAVLQFHTDTVRCLSFSDGKVNGRNLMAAGSKDGSLSLWSLYSD